MRNRLIIILSLVVFGAIIFLPPIIKGYVYPSIGDDTAAHMNILEWVGWFAPENTEPVELIRYSAYYIVGYPMDVVSHVFNLDKDTLFLWFNYLALFGVGVTLFFIFKNLMGLRAGLLALFVPVFTSYSILLLFYSGVIFEIINVSIILPWACYMGIKFLLHKKKRYLVGATGFFSLFAVFHSTGIYLIFIIVGCFIAYIIYRMAKRQPVYTRGYTLATVAYGIFVIFFFLFNPIMPRLYELLLLPSEGVAGFTLLIASLLHYMSYLLLVVLIISVALLVGKYKQINKAEKLTVLTFGILAVIMLPAILFGWSPQPFRQGYDFAIFLSLVSVGVVSIAIRLCEHRLVTYLLVGMALFGAIVHISDWGFGYNSALEKIDVEAIRYINTLPGDSFSCSDNVDHWVYGRYVDKGYSPKDGEIFVKRNVPMKSKVALVEEGDLTTDMVYLNRFTDGEVEIVIYK
jgi:hypothetical protein